jgi:DNA-binding NarL/FixJ family response regulator/anti-sigma regulatory factor (Ser/Thr protein kinase)
MSADTLPLSERLRVLVVDDNDGFRGSLAALLCGEDLEVVGEAADGAEAIERARELSPDVVLMDIRMPGMDGIEATRRLKALRPSVEVVALTGLEEQRAVRDMLVAGAAGYVLKDSDGDQIVNAVRRAADGGALLSPSVTPTVIDELIEALERERRRTRQLEIAQEALLERGARRQQLIGRVGHELRTPVTVMLGLAQTLRRGGLAPEQLDAALDTLVARAEGLARLVRRFEAALEAGLTEWVNVTELAREVAGRDPRVGVEAPAAPVMTALNRTAGIRILEELVENALAFSPAASDVVIRVTPTAGTTEIRVIDRGNGIDPESVARIFEPLEQEQDLHTRTHQGLGLGLSLARLSARAMDGDVTLESTGLAGSTFLWSVAGGSAELDDLPARAAATG